MPDQSWPAPLLFTLAIVAAALGAGAALGTNLIMSLRRLRRHDDRQTADLARRLRLLESRIQRADGPEGVTAVPKGPALSTRRAISIKPKTGLPKAVPDTPILIAVPNLAVRDPAPDDRFEIELGQRHGQAWTLAAAGASAEEIARQTGQPLGQVELIVGLYRQLHGSRGPTRHARTQ